MPAMMVIPNPRKKHRRRRPMTAKQRKYFGKRSRRSTTIVVRRNPIATAASPQPIRRSRRRRIGTYIAAARRRFSRRGGSRGGFVGEIMSFAKNDLVPAGIGAGGALALDMLWPHLPLPAALQSGPMVPLVRIAGAVGVGMAVSAVAGRSMGRQAMAGALVVTLYDIAKDMMANALPAPAATSAYVSGMGVYNDQLGYISPAYNAGRARMGVYV